MTLREMLFERAINQKEKLGCLMAMVDESICPKLIAFNQKLIKDEDIFHKLNDKGEDEYGREKECHITVRYGFTKDLNELDLRQLLAGQKEFTVTITGLDMFDTNPEFDVVKFNIESPLLTQLNTLTQIYPNRTDFPDYHPHLTLAYVKKGTFSHKKRLQMEIPIKSMCYSPISGDKSYFSLNEIFIPTDVDSRIVKLEQEWERIDSTGVGKSQQRKIEQELRQLRHEKGKYSKPNIPVDTDKAKELFARMRLSL